MRKPGVSRSVIGGPCNEAALTRGLGFGMTAPAAQAESDVGFGLLLVAAKAELDGGGRLVLLSRRNGRRG